MSYRVNREKILTKKLSDGAQNDTVVTTASEYCAELTVARSSGACMSNRCAVCGPACQSLFMLCDFLPTQSVSQ